MALLILVLGVASITQMRTDIFPEIDIPVVTMIWTYKGMDAGGIREADHHLQRIRDFVGGRSTSRRSNRRRSTASRSSRSSSTRVQRRRRHGAGDRRCRRPFGDACRPASQPPIILRFNASSVPIVQLALGSENAVGSRGLRLRPLPPAAGDRTVQGLTLPPPYGGKQRQIMVDLDPQALQAKGISPKEVADAVNAYNLALPDRRGPHRHAGIPGQPEQHAGDGRRASTTFRSRSSTARRSTCATSPRSATASPSQTTVVRRDGSRGALLTILKNGNASTLDIVNQVKAMLPAARAPRRPRACDIELLVRSVAVRAGGGRRRGARRASSPGC